MEAKQSYILKVTAVKMSNVDKNLKALRALSRKLDIDFAAKSIKEKVVLSEARKKYIGATDITLARKTVVVNGTQNDIRKLLLVDKKNLPKDGVIELSLKQKPTHRIGATGPLLDAIESY